MWGAQQKEDFCLFRLYCPKAVRIDLVLFEWYDQKKGREYAMDKLDDGNWHLKLPGRQTGKYYAFRIEHPDHIPGLLHTDELIADPWSEQVTTVNHFRQYARSRIAEPVPFDWEGDTFIIPPEQRDLVIYEAHVRDMTAHPSSGAKSPGTYLGLTERGITGGISHLKRLGVNAVELLPLQKFAGFEPPYHKKTPEGYYNTWNPYSRNYWGYMTSFFFAPETLYATGGSNRPGEITGDPEAASLELKTMVRELHKEGITVIMDVVYNHVSQYDLNPLKHLDLSDFFRTDAHGNLTSESGCGNDLRTESPYIREMIISSVLWWMKEYHIDGFRFDLANLIDRDTIAEIRHEAQKINPNVLLIAEPWGGGYDPTGFSGFGWSAWNDQIRNGVKGFDPVHSPGFIFGKWHYETNRESLENYVRGTLLHEPNGRFHHQEHSVNYLESHDGYTLADFIRIALDPQKAGRRFAKKSELIALTDRELRTSRLAALFLMTSQGIPMIHSGQEWGRSKWIDSRETNDPHHGRLDHNSYEKDNATNYLDFTEIEHNRPLFDYYRGLIRIRKYYPQLRLADPGDITFHSYEDALHLTFEIYSPKIAANERLLISLNGNPEATHRITLPEGEWRVLADHEATYPDQPRRIESGSVEVPPVSGIILRQSVSS
ncbi:alpha-amylase family glycosyl hydrolase [Balneolales bacterium ANBcel1]|nr:alpha-amylase family glycosyl hydrolase [Balneolales bacterium ANBcel1]